MNWEREIRLDSEYSMGKWKFIAREQGGSPLLKCQLRHLWGGTMGGSWPNRFSRILANIGQCRGNMEVQMLKPGWKCPQRNLSWVCLRKASLSQCTELRKSDLSRELLEGSRGLVRMTGDTASCEALQFVLLLYRQPGSPSSPPLWYT